MRRRFVVLGNPENRRVSGFAEACRSLGWTELVIVSWTEVLQDVRSFNETLRGASGLRIESPGENFQVERALIALGSDEAGEEKNWPSISSNDAEMLQEDHGRLRYQRQWYRGWGHILREIGSIAARCDVPMMNAPADIAVAFDKLATQVRLKDAGVPVARNLGICEDFRDLQYRMSEARIFRVFLKPCHGSSASGVVAVETDGKGRWRATSSADLTEEGGEMRIHNSLRLQTLTDPDRIGKLIDEVCKERAMAEQWIPKASVGGRNYDLRIVVIRGVAAHVVVRTSRSPITNLHLGNERGDPAMVRLQLGEDKWKRAMRTAESAAACFPGCHYLGIDLMIDSALRNFVVAEVNAFGDLLPRVVWNGMNTWEAELQAWVDSMGSP